MTASATTRRYALALVCASAALSLVAGPLQTAFAAGTTTATTDFAPLSAKSRPASAHTPTTRATVTSTAANRTQAARTAAVKAASAAATAADFGSIFATQVPTLTNSGWTTCGAPITWSVDTRELSAAEAAEQIDNLTWAFAAWSTASGLTFQFTGETATTYNDTAFSLIPSDGSAVANRHIYLAFVNNDESDRLGGNVVGLGSPAKVMPASKEIIAGTAVFRTDHVASTPARMDKSLYLHELGHVLGLAHAADDGNIMYPVVTDHVALGAGDVNGVKTMTKACAA